VKRDFAHLLDAALPVLCAAGIAVGAVVNRGGLLWPLALGLPAAFVLLARHRWPAATLLVSGGLVLVLFAIDHGAGAIAVVAPAAALYSLALTQGRIHLIAATTAAVVAVVLADIFLAGRHVVTLQTFAHVALIAVPVLAAGTLRNRRSYIQTLLEKLELAERTREEEAQRRAEQERLRIARDLHDVVAHTLTTINVQAGVAAHLLDRDPSHAKGALTAIEAASHDALDELRTVLGVLREPEGGQAPLEPAPGLANIGELLEQAREIGLPASLEVDGEQPGSVPDAVQLAAYRIVQESLTNARRHAPGAVASVSLRYGQDRLRLTVENETVAGAGGTGAREDTAARETPVDRHGNGNGAGGHDGNGARPGVGIVGMRERATALGGTLEAGPCDGAFRVVAELPYRRSA
jgi:signal transduction histidine kinase